MQFAYNGTFIKNTSFLAVKKPSFWGHHFLHSIQLGTVNMPVELKYWANTTASVSIALGLYSLTGNTLSLLNSASFTSVYSSTAATSVQSWFSFTGFNASTIIPGTWYWGVWFSTNTSLSISPCHWNLTNIAAQGDITVIGGEYSTTSNTLPTTMDLANLTGQDSFFILVAGN
jgi:hypothetical protein